MAQEKKTRRFFLYHFLEKMSNYIHLLTSLSGYNCTELSRLFGIGKCFFFCFFFCLFILLSFVFVSFSCLNSVFTLSGLTTFRAVLFSIFLGVYPRREATLWENNNNNNNKSYMYNSISILICKSITLFSKRQRLYR